MSENVIEQKNCDRMLLKLQKMRVSLIDKNIEMTGENTYSKYKYFQLSDFLPELQKIMLEHSATAINELIGDKAVLTLINLEDFEDRVSFSLPIAEAGVKGASGIQQVGALSTYMRRYLYMTAFEISEADSEDENHNTDDPEKEMNNKSQEVKSQYISPVKIKMIEKELERTGITLSAISERYKVESVQTITEGIFPKVYEALKKTADKA
jgi:hypothetical protein